VAQLGLGLQGPVDASAANPQALGDCNGPEAFGAERSDPSPIDGRRSALVDASELRFGDAFEQGDQPE
jgi:hypothetical protein